jgi:predicted transcriptional regulator
MKLECKSIEAIEEEISRKSKMNPENGRLYSDQEDSCLNSTVGKGSFTERRSRTDIAVEILKVTMNGAKKTHVEYEANLTFNNSISCWNMLVHSCYIREKNAKKY